MDEGSEGLPNADENYYAFLNISRTANAEEINSAYRQLSRIYHPDKHVDPAKKSDAETLFNRTKRAYEVLSDPHKRAIYDSLGKKGLETEGWEVVLRERTPMEIREEYEELARKKEERRLQQRTNPRGNISVAINASEILNPYVDEFDEKMFPTVEVTGMGISQSIECPLTMRDTVTMRGYMNTHNGNGSGNFQVSGRRLLNKGWVELDVGAGDGPMIGCKGSRNLTQSVFCNFGMNLNFRSNVIIPILNGTLACQLNKHTVGYLTYNAGARSSMSTVLEQSNERHHWQLTVMLGVPNCYVAASYMRKLPEYELKLRVATKIGTTGFNSEYGAEKKVSKYSSVGASVSFGVPSGVYLKLKIIRSAQTFIFPIYLSDEIVPAALFYATTTPVLLWFLAKHLLIDPMNADQRRRDLKKQCEANKQRMAEKKREAEISIGLMSATFSRIQEEERRRGGLIIEKAVYGQLEAAAEEETPSRVVDVTVALQCQVRGSKLILVEAGKSELPGFYDPCMGEPKQLRVEYMYQGQKHTVTVADDKPVRIPTAAQHRQQNGASNSSNISENS